MAHAMIVAKMRDIGTAAGRTLTRDPMNGYLANLDPDDYKQLFRPYLPESTRGSEFIDKFGSTIDAATTVEPETDYHVQLAADHHVLEARRVKQFVGFIEQAGSFSPGAERSALLNKAGHLMYASHKSYRDKALLGAPECDLLEELVRKNEQGGLYGAKITGGGSGGTVAVLCDASPAADEALSRIMAEYQRQTGHQAELFAGSSDGAWWMPAVAVS
jgi:L-arabinokinase